jgi:hypothetical protein
MTRRLPSGQPIDKSMPRAVCCRSYRPGQGAEMENVDKNLVPRAGGVPVHYFESNSMRKEVHSDFAPLLWAHSQCPLAFGSTDFVYNITFCTSYFIRARKVVLQRKGAARKRYGHLECRDTIMNRKQTVSRRSRRPNYSAVQQLQRGLWYQ